MDADQFRNLALVLGIAVLMAIILFQAWAVMKRAADAGFFGCHFGPMM